MSVVIHSRRWERRAMLRVMWGGFTHPFMRRAAAESYVDRIVGEEWDRAVQRGEIEVVS